MGGMEVVRAVDLALYSKFPEFYNGPVFERFTLSKRGDHFFGASTQVLSLRSSKMGLF